MTFDEFDQTKESGWRALAQRGDFMGAAQVIEGYLADHSDLEGWQIETLHFHAVQMYAFAGTTDQALSHLPLSRKPDEPADTPIRWNDYVTATEAFLRGDLPGLLAARERIAQGPTWNDSIPNLHVVDRLIEHFGKPYADAY